MSDLNVDSTAREMVAAIASREISCSELMDLHLARIAERNPELNAIVSLDEERARDGASEADRTPYDERGPLHGLPWAFKDTHAVAGWRTTYGSPLYADHVPARDELIVERIRAAGAVPIGKTNVPEFAAGSATPSTRSSAPPSTLSTRREARAGRAGERAARWRPAWCRWPTAPTWAARCATRRRSAAWSGCARASAGCRSGPSENQWETHLGRRADGPHRRRPGPVAVVLAGPDPRVPLALGDPGATFAPPLSRHPRSACASRSAPTSAALIEVDARGGGGRRGRRGRAMAAAGARVSAGAPRPAPRRRRPFRTLRAWHFQARFGQQLAEHPDAFKASLADNIRAGEPLTGADVARAYRDRTALAETMRPLLREYDVLVLPTSQVPPFPADQEFPADDQRQADGRPTWTGCGRRTSSPSPAARPSRCRPARPATGSRSASRSSPPHGADRRLLEVAAAFEALGSTEGPSAPPSRLEPDERGSAASQRGGKTGRRSALGQASSARP